MGRLVLPLVFGLFFVIISVSPSGGGGASCKGCHKDVYDKAASYLFPHPPVKDGCVKCHIINKSDRGGRQFRLKGYYMESLLPLEWLSWKEEYDIEVVVKDRKGRSSPPSFLAVTPSQTKEVLEDSKTPPVIKDVVVEAIKPGVFVEAIVKWKTNKPTLFEIEYGLNAKYGERREGEKVFVKDHKVRLIGLHHNKTYHYRIISKDPLGNHAVSEGHTIDTSKPKEEKEEKDRLVDLSPSIEELKPLRTEDGSIYLLIKSNTLSNVSLKLAPKKVKIKKHGSGLAPKRFSGIEACIKCHSQGASHPVGIPARSSNTSIPDTLPTGEGGIITCTTCHIPHGGMVRYLARFDFQRDICVLCHTDF